MRGTRACGICRLRLKAAERVAIEVNLHVFGPAPQREGDRRPLTDAGRDVDVSPRIREPDLWRRLRAGDRDTERSANSDIETKRGSRITRDERTRHRASEHGNGGTRDLRAAWPELRRRIEGDLRARRRPIG